MVDLWWVCGDGYCGGFVVMVWWICGDGVVSFNERFSDLWWFLGLVFVAIFVVILIVNSTT